MHVDLDKLADKVLPWDLTITIKKKKHRVPPLSVAHLDALSRFNQLNNQEAVDAILSVFGDPKPAIAGLSMPEYTVIVGVIMTAHKDHLAKNSQAVAAFITDATAKKG